MLDAGSQFAASNVSALTDESSLAQVVKSKVRRQNIQEHPVLTKHCITVYMFAMVAEMDSVHWMK